MVQVGRGTCALLAMLLLLPLLLLSLLLLRLPPLPRLLPLPPLSRRPAPASAPPRAPPALSPTRLVPTPPNTATGPAPPILPTLPRRAPVPALTHPDRQFERYWNDVQFMNSRNEENKARSKNHIVCPDCKKSMVCGSLYEHKKRCIGHRELTPLEEL